MPPAALRDARVILTVVGGQVVYELNAGMPIRARRALIALEEGKRETRKETKAMFALVRSLVILVCAVGVSTAACSSGAPADKTAVSTPAGSTTAGTTVADSSAKAASAQSPGVQLAPPAKPVSATPISVTSATFQPEATLPTSTEFDGCGGRNQSPQLTWEQLSAGDKEFRDHVVRPQCADEHGILALGRVRCTRGSVTTLRTGAGSVPRPRRMRSPAIRTSASVTTVVHVAPNAIRAPLHFTV